MRTSSLYYALFCTLWQLSCGASPPQRDTSLPAVVIATQEQIDTLQVVANRYIVLFKSLPGLARESFVGYRAETVHFSPFLNEMYHYDAGITDIRLISAVTLPSMQDNTFLPLDTLNWQQGERPPTGIIVEVRFASNALAAAHLQHWQARGDIYFAEPVYIGLVEEDPSESEEDSSQPENVTDYDALRREYDSYQMHRSENFWWHKEINLADAFGNIAQAVKDDDSNYRSWDDVNQTIVAIFDSGIDHEHPALKSKMLQLATRYDLACGDDRHGCNTTNPLKGELGDGHARPWGTNPHWAKRLDKAEGGACPRGGDDVGFASCSHGTHVAGIIAADGGVGADGGNNCKIAGVCPFCKIINIRVLTGVGAGGPEDSRTGGVTDTSILNGLKYVHELWRKRIEVRVINASIGKFHRSRAVALLINNLKHKASTDEGKGVLVVGAAGNEDTMARTYPAALKDVLAVSATGANGSKSRFSNFGMWVDIAAPGGSSTSRICSTVPGDGYEKQAGTSMATPVVAGVAGLMVAVRAEPLSAEQIENRLLFSSNPDKLYPDKEKNKDLFRHNRNRTHYLAKLDNTEHPVPLLGFGLLDADTAVRGEVTPAQDIIAQDPVHRVDIVACGTVDADVSAYPLSLLLLLPLLGAGRQRCRSSCT